MICMNICYLHLNSIPTRTAPSFTAPFNKTAKAVRKLVLGNMFSSFVGCLFGGVWISTKALSFVVIKSDRQDLPVCLVIIDHGNDTKDPQLESQIESIQDL